MLALFVYVWVPLGTDLETKIQVRTVCSELIPGDNGSEMRSELGQGRHGSLYDRGSFCWEILRVNVEHIPFELSH